MAELLELQIRQATHDDVETLIQWRTEAATWIRAVHESKQWATVPSHDKAQRWIDSGEIFMVEIEGSRIPVATIGISRVGEPALWKPDEVKENSLYLSRLIVDREYSGRRIGESVIGWCQTQALTVGCSWIRLDVWRTNKKLQEYYKHIGFEHVRTVQDHIAGAVFQRSCEFDMAKNLHQIDFREMDDVKSLWSELT